MTFHEKFGQPVKSSTVWKEIAKFACGAEAFHALMHAYFWLSGTTLTVLSITLTPTLSIGAAIVNVIIALLLGLYAWLDGANSTRSSNGPPPGKPHQ